jgi:hypothetical protein
MSFPYNPFCSEDEAAETEIIVTQQETASAESEAPNSRTFHEFSNLPKEIQLKILKYHWETPRVVPVWVSRGKAYVDRSKGNSVYRQAQVFMTEYPEPPIMRINKEIRAEVLRSGFYRNISSAIKDPYNYYKRCIEIPWRDISYPTYCANIWLSKGDLVCPTIKKGGSWTSLNMHTFGRLMNDSKVERIALDTFLASARVCMSVRRTYLDPFPPFVMAFLTPHIREIAFYTAKEEDEITASTKFIAEQSARVRFTKPYVECMFERFQKDMYELKQVVEGNHAYHTHTPWLYENPKQFVRPSVTYMQIEDESMQTNQDESDPILLHASSWAVGWGSMDIDQFELDPILLHACSWAVGWGTMSEE